MTEPKDKQTQATEEKENPIKTNDNENKPDDAATLAKRREAIDEKVKQMPKEYGGRSKDKGLEPTRYDDWEYKGRCIDF